MLELFFENHSLSCLCTWTNSTWFVEQMAQHQWTNLRTHMDLEGPTLSFDQVYLGCTQRAAESGVQMLKTTRHILEDVCRKLTRLEAEEHEANPLERKHIGYHGNCQHLQDKMSGARKKAHSLEDKKRSWINNRLCEGGGDVVGVPLLAE